MKKSEALRLHKGDEVTVKKTGAIVTVLDSWEEEDGSVTVATDCDGYTELGHREIC